ncbi:outer membrane protein transport protein [Paraglaciecola aestuariivivens]
MKFKSSLLSILVCALPMQTFAAAFQLAEHNASGLGRAFAGEAALADSAAVVARNPALMSTFKQSQLSIVATYIKPDVAMTGTSAPAYSNVSALDDDSIAPEALIPATYFVTPINKAWSVGMGVFSNFGLATEFSDTYAAGQLAGTSEITTVNFNVSLAYKFNSQFSLGLGLNYIYADAAIERHFGANPLGLSAETVAASLTGDDHGYGWNLGASYAFNKDSRLGLHYRSKTTLNFDGEYTNQLPQAFGGLAGATLPGALELTLPATAELSGWHQLDKKWGLNYSLVWTQWQSFDALQAFVPVSETPVFYKKENFSNSMRYALGGSYQWSKVLKLRAGIAYDESPADAQHLSISIPDSNRVWLSSGASVILDKRSSVDLGISVIEGQTREFTETDNLGANWGFNSQGNAFLLAVQYNYSF